MAPDTGAIDHVLPVVGQPQIDQRLQQRIPHALLGPSPEPDIDRVPLAVALMHVAPRATDPQDVEHPIEETPVIACWPRPAPSLGRQQRSDHFPFFVRQIPARHGCSRKKQP